MKVRWGNSELGDTRSPEVTEVTSLEVSSAFIANQNGRDTS